MSASGPGLSYTGPRSPGFSYPPSPMPPAPAPSYQPPKQPLPWGKIAIGVGVAGAVVLVGYGVYAALNGLFGGGAGAGLTACESNWTTAYEGWSKQQQAYQQANVAAGLPATLTSAQLAALQPYVNQMNSAETCVQTEANYNVTTWAEVITVAAIGVAAIIGVTSYFKARLAAKGGAQRLTSGSEARATMRGSLAQDQLENGEITPGDAASLNSQAASEGAAEASTEQAVTGAQASADTAAAESAGEGQLYADIESFTTNVIDTVVIEVEDVYDYFAALLA